MKSLDSLPSSTAPARKDPGWKDFNMNLQDL
jgi:hypothetical protein